VKHNKTNTHLKKGSVLFTTAILIGGIVTGVYLEKGATKMWGEEAGSFMLGLARNPQTVGAFAPCSTYTAVELSRFVVPYEDRKIRVLEVGAGTGVVTKEIIKRLEGYNYEFDVIEIDPDFCKTLYKRFGYNRNVSINAIDILQWAPEKKYDIIISILPYSNFSEDFVKSVLHKFTNLLKENGRISYVKTRVPEIMRRFFLRKRPEEYLRREALIENFKNKYLDEEVLILKNILPLDIIHLKVNTTG